MIPRARAEAIAVFFLKMAGTLFFLAVLAALLWMAENL